ncbi:hypothetical protein FGO68_gene6840 [Halteria grandinella]|uniref:Transmembrane protein n=1 Tax=Halteria grandinella TaxID=5974 RepID=A0A8J8NKD7_HALGN|nr:hypothetical protein FGO68_gene6840 [Halteria grandinella]
MSKLSSTTFVQLYFNLILFNGLLSVLMLLCCAYLFFERPSSDISYGPHLQLIVLSCFYSICIASFHYLKKDDEDWRGTIQVSQKLKLSYVYFFFVVISSCLLFISNIQIQLIGMKLSSNQSNFNFFYNFQLVLLIGGIFFQKSSICCFWGGNECRNFDECFLCFVILSFIPAVGKYLVWPVVAFSTLSLGLKNMQEHYENHPSMADVIQLTLCILTLLQVTVQSACTFIRQKGIFLKNDAEYNASKYSSDNYQRVVDSEK